MDEADKIPALLERFCEAAIRKGDSGLSTDEDLGLYARMGEIVRELRAVSPHSMEAFRVLLRHQSPHVQLWVASELLSDGDHDAKATLENLAGTRGLIGLNASVVLDQFKSGTLKSPFAQ